MFETFIWLCLFAYVSGTVGAVISYMFICKPKTTKEWYEFIKLLVTAPIMLPYEIWRRK